MERIELTDRERQIADLVAEEDCTDCEIAQVLKISHRTVQAHLRNIRNKTGVRKRGELKTWLSALAETDRRDSN